MLPRTVSDRLVNTDNNLSYVYKNFPIQSENIWYCNITRKDIQKHFAKKSHDSLWLGTWKACADYNYSNPIAKVVVLSPFLWFNSNIKWGRELFVIHNVIYENIMQRDQLGDHLFKHER